LSASCARNLFPMHLKCQLFILSLCTLIWTDSTAVSIPLDVKLYCLITAATTDV
jgi:hypothetical protein